MLSLLIETIRHFEETGSEQACARLQNGSCNVRPVTRSVELASQLIQAAF